MLLVLASGLYGFTRTLPSFDLCALPHLAGLSTSAAASEAAVFSQTCRIACPLLSQQVAGTGVYRLS